MQAQLDFETLPKNQEKPVIIASGKEAAKEVAVIDYNRHPTPFGEVLIASTSCGICELHFTDVFPENPLITLQHKYPSARWQEVENPLHNQAVKVISGQPASDITLHLFGTPFQLRVWRALAEIPTASMCTYGQLSSQLGLAAGASRAVGAAVGQNTIAVLVPCHRVVAASGKLTGFRWGIERKQQLLQAEQSNVLKQ